MLQPNMKSPSAGARRQGRSVCVCVCACVLGKYQSHGLLPTKSLRNGIYHLLLMQIDHGFRSGIQTKLFTTGSENADETYTEVSKTKEDYSSITLLQIHLKISFPKKTKFK